MQAPQAPQLLQDFVQPLPLNELHGIVVDAPALADIENRNNIGVMQPGSRARLPPKTLQVRRIATQSERQHLQGDVTAQRFLDRFVDHPHAAAANLSKDVIIAQLFQGSSIGRDAGGAGVNRPGFLGTCLFNHDQGGKDLVDFLGQIGVSLGVFTDGRPFAAPIALDKLLGQLIDRVAPGLTHWHLPQSSIFFLSFMSFADLHSSENPGALIRIFRNRLSART